MKNREIKFRAWDKKDNVMREVKKIDFSEKKVYCNDYYLNDWKFEEVELMQFTGLYDKNGKEIYEGDVVRFKLFDEATPCYWEVKIPNIYLAMKNEENHQIEVIGNRYQNPELLVDKKNAS